MEKKSDWRKELTKVARVVIVLACNTISRRWSR